MVVRYNESTRQFYIDPQHVADGARVWASEVVSTLGYHGLSRSKFPGGHTFVVAEGRIYRWRGSSLDLRFDPVTGLWEEGTWGRASNARGPTSVRLKCSTGPARTWVGAPGYVHPW